jgi:uncharacterized integral membrane protein
MLKSGLKINHLLIYRSAFVLGALMSLVGAVFIGTTQQESTWAAYSRYLLVSLCGLSFVMTFVNQTWRRYIGETSLLICYVYSIHVASVLYDQHISPVSVLYSLTGLSCWSWCSTRLPWFSRTRCRL